MTKILTIPSKLEDAIKKDNLVIFVGAGCSMPLGFPSWKKLIENILEDLNTRYGETSSINFKNVLTGIESGKSLFDALNKIENDADHGATYKKKSKELINKLIDTTQRKLSNESLVHDLLWKISKKIITTNYDKTLENYIDKSIPVKVFDNSNAFQILNNQSGDSQFLYKIHGDYENPDTIILFESDYKDIYNNDNYNNDALATYYKDKTLLFIGFSLSDPFVNDLFTKIKKIYKGYTINEHFVFTTKNEDFIEYDITSIKINDWNESLHEYLLKLEKIKLENRNTNNETIIIDQKSPDKELTSDDVNNIVNLITQKTNELLSNPSDKELATEVKDLRTKLDKLLYGKVDYLSEVDRPFRNNDLQILFDIIYSSEKLNSQTLEQIQKIRSSSEIYKWYDRSVIVSAITCSLIHFNKADEQKITLLIDFINDSEEKVWQKSITSLFMVLNHLGNKWLRFNSLKTKIKSLNENSRIQNACSTIIKLFTVGLNNISMVNEELFNNPYFSDSPFNYFLPYHQDENPAFDLVYETYEGDVEEFITFLNQVPIPDQLKYLFCSKTNKNNDRINDSNEEKNPSDTLRYILNYNSLFYPYSIYVQELISFYNYFPIFKHEEKLKCQLKLTETPLKDYLLNAKQKHTALGSHFMYEENWSQAIVNYKESIKLDENDISNLINLAQCYNNIKDYNDEFYIRSKIKIIDPNNEKNLQSLFNYYQRKKEFNNSVQIAEQLLIIDNKNPEYYNYKGVAFKELEDYEKALDSYNKAIELDSNYAFYYANRGNLLYLMDNFDQSLSDWNMSINIDSKNETFYYGRALLYYKLKRYEDSNKELDIAISINKKNPIYFFTKANNYLFLSLFDNALKNIEKAKSLNLDKSDFYHFFSNYYRLIKDFDKAFEYIEKAEAITKDKSYTGTKATIYASIGDLENFYKYLEEAFIEKAKASQLYSDIISKFKDEPRFIALLLKYNQKI